ncbi:MAG: prepilin-type N-terminal cleavage/methylation domain-containing protein [Planctomycetaceae bacterium]|nr:prepilin-type N-terminal cleavage/methylation domain-containing protein [Planctomycetaceae bacterium]
MTTMPASRKRVAFPVAAADGVKSPRALASTGTRDLVHDGELPPSAPRTQNPTRRSAFTLFELLLAIVLSSLLMAAVYSAFSTYITLSTDSYEDVLRTQIARTILRQMSRDIQSVVFIEQDTTDDEDSDDSTTDNSATADVGASMLLYTDGLVGNANELLLYVSRPDRDLNYISQQELTSTADRTGDLVLIRYMIANSATGGVSKDIVQQEASASFKGSYGLVRMTGDLYGLATAIDSSEEQDQLAAAKVLAQEVSQVEFSYFDGTAWQEEWDSTALNMMPLAVRITLTLRTPEPDDPSDLTPAQRRDASPDTTHSLVVNCPLAKPFAMESAL